MNPAKLDLFCAANSAPSTRVMTREYRRKADLAFMLFAAELGQIGQMHRDGSNFPVGTLTRAYDS
jgi:hypothetical protein